MEFKKILSAEGLENIFFSFEKVHKRFPFTLLASFLGSIFLIYNIHQETKDPDFIKTIFSFALGVPLLFSAEIFNERKLTHKWIPLLLSILFLFGFWYFAEVETKYKEERPFVILVAVLAITFHLLVSVAPYLGGLSTKNENIAIEQSQNQFWQYNKTLFLAILNAFLYSATLAGGLCLAVMAVDKLFDLKVNYKWYAYLFVFINGYCNTNFFLAKLPGLDVIDSKTDDYPLGLKYFTQYVLLPLITIYICILLAYEFKIIVNWSLPKGWVSVLVMASAIFGILSFLLLYPLRNSNKWVANFTKLYYWVLVPLIVLMMVAITVRIKEYGVTEPRYFIAIVSVWLLGISLYFSFSKIDNIKVIPISLIIIGLLSIFGPFNAFFASRLNQDKRLMSILSENKLLENGKIKVMDGLKLNEKSAQKLDAAVDYFTHNHLKGLEKYLQVAQFDSLAKTDKYNRENKFYDLVNLPKNIINADKINSINRIQTSVDSLQRADYMIFIGNYMNDQMLVGGSKIQFKSNENLKSNIYSFVLDGENIAFNLSPLLKLDGYNLPSEKLTFLAESKNWKVRLLLDSGTFSENKNIENFSGRLYFTKK